MKKVMRWSGEMNVLQTIVTHPLLALVFRLYLGGLFVYAAMYKINFTAEFASTIASYQIVPYFAVNSMAVFLPWMELLCGLMLIVGLRARAATLIIGGLLVLFTVAIVVTLLRDLPISCGCFHTVDDPISWWTVARDLTWVAMAAHVYCFDRLFQLDQLFFQKLKDVEA